MSTLPEIEAAIETLPAPQLEELAVGLQGLRTRRVTPPEIDAWLEQARGAAMAGVTTAAVMAETRGEE